MVVRRVSNLLDFNSPVSWTRSSVTSPTPGDPRCPGKTLYPLTDVLVIAVCAVIAGAESYEDIAIYGRSKRHWLAQFLDLTHGIPSHSCLPPRVHARGSRGVRDVLRKMGSFTR